MSIKNSYLTVTDQFCGAGGSKKMKIDRSKSQEEITKDFPHLTRHEQAAVLSCEFKDFSPRKGFKCSEYFYNN